ncbi:MAG: hypothetical protein KFF77_12235 [Bacteroidetes bacterium]|nr:hypothetical protein [Bacteroidota bacterium]
MQKREKLPPSSNAREAHGYEKKHQQLRQRINDAFFGKHWTRSQIREYFGVSSHTVLRWTQAADQDCSADGRGWRKGVMRSHSSETLERISLIHHELSSNPKDFFTGASAIAREWSVRFTDPPPPVRTIGIMLKELHLSTSRKKGRGKGAAAYLHYPEHTLYHGMGGRVIEADYIGRKFLTGRSAPLCFVSFSAKMNPKIRAYKRVEAETGQAMIEWSSWFFSEYEEPDFIKFDNAAPLIGSTSGKRTISQVARFFLARGIVPIYSVPRKPFSQASVEGSNSVFARKFWNARRFSSLEDIDTQLGWFNAALIRYHGYEPRTRSRPGHFTPRIYFLRQVHESPEKPGFGMIDVQHELIHLPLAYVKYFVLAEWDLETQRLTVHFENEQQLTAIHQQTFPINGKKFEL